MAQVRAVQDTDWPAIVAIQAQAYAPELLESEAALRAKAQMLPNLCSVLEDAEGVRAYCLAHAWSAASAPSLHATSHQRIDGDNIFLHDLALQPSCRGLGYARLLLEDILAQARAANFRSFTLVAVQNSAPFWSRFGFVADERSLPASYGEGAVFMSLRL